MQTCKDSSKGKSVMQVRCDARKKYCRLHRHEGNMFLGIALMRELALEYSLTLC